MNKYILIGGSITATILVVLVSFTSAVGVQSVESDFVDSPLFGIRTQRATDSNSQDIACEYVGKNKEIMIPLPKRDNKILMVHNLITAIRQMNDETYTRYVEAIVHHFQRDKQLSDIATQNMVTELYQLRNHADDENRHLIEYTIHTQWFPGCILSFILEWIMECIVSIFTLIYLLFLFIYWQCVPTANPFQCTSNCRI